MAVLSANIYRWSESPEPYGSPYQLTSTVGQTHQNLMVVPSANIYSWSDSPEPYGSHISQHLQVVGLTRTIWQSYSSNIYR